MLFELLTELRYILSPPRSQAWAWFISNGTGSVDFSGVNSACHQSLPKDLL